MPFPQPPDLLQPVLLQFAPWLPVPRLPVRRHPDLRPPGPQLFAQLHSASHPPAQRQRLPPRPAQRLPTQLPVPRPPSTPVPLLPVAQLRVLRLIALLPYAPQLLALHPRPLELPLWQFAVRLPVLRLPALWPPPSQPHSHLFAFPQHPAPQRVWQPIFQRLRSPALQPFSERQPAVPLFSPRPLPLRSSSSSSPAPSPPCPHLHV